MVEKELAAMGSFCSCHRPSDTTFPRAQRRSISASLAGQQTSETDARLLATNALVLCYTLGTNDLSSSSVLLAREYLAAVNRVQDERDQSDQRDMVQLLLDVCANDLQGIITRAALHSLPPEVLGNIFEYTVDAVKCHRHILRQPRTLRLVCRRWNSVAVGFPRLWSTLPIALTHTVMDMGMMTAFERQLRCGLTRSANIKLLFLPLTGPSIPSLANRPDFFRQWSSLPSKWLAARPSLVQRIAYIEVNLVVFLPLLVSILQQETPRLRTVLLPNVAGQENVLASCFSSHFAKLSHMELGSFPPRSWTAGDKLVHLALFFANGTPGYGGEGDAKVLETAVSLKTLIVSDLRESQRSAPANVARVRLTGLSQLHLRIRSSKVADAWLSKIETPFLSELLVARPAMTTTLMYHRPFHWPSKAGQNFLKTCDPVLLTSLSLVNVEINQSLAPFITGRPFRTLILLPPFPSTTPARVLNSVVAVGNSLQRLGVALNPSSTQSQDFIDALVSRTEHRKLKKLYVNILFEGNTAQLALLPHRLSRTAEEVQMEWYSRHKRSLQGLDLGGIEEDLLRPQFRREVSE
ncbi:hypothetical protein CYLTODRAFT_459007 [Cylindrobasidium torrendii FP15055 ss-10]|uniref:F-box domain-containing protein n=1 Tax=Cylindrobasidium torrendii FP15055 ss-10 TaxID=1314674 RepID=A0A0D7AYT1_9AGAR|nr:hypothetical protein CYLTODRAFT_459007 [Cylindrobasidium torrendii FP15055 ss-10]